MNQAAFPQADMEYQVRMRTVTELISRLFQVAVTEAETSKQTDDFCRKNRFHRIQFYLDEKVLELTRTTLNAKIIFSITDVFNICFLMFSMRNVPLILGPFCRERMTLSGAAAIIGQYDLGDTDAASLLAYCASYPTISEQKALNIVSSMICAVEPSEPDKSVRQIASHPGAVIQAEIASEMRANHNTLLEKRYAAERLMMEYIFQGNARAAVQQLHQVEQDVSYLNNIISTIEGEKYGATILRTTVRHVAIQVGLPALVIDRITHRNLEAIHAARDEHAVHMAKETVIREICEAIRTAREKQYSALVQNTLYYLENEYDKEISIEQLSAEFGVSANHLISSFRKEMNATPNAYLNRVRMRKAADFLANGQWTIGEISARVGISDPNYFVKLFKKEYGETPSAYRKRHTI